MENGKKLITTILLAAMLTIMTLPLAIDNVSAEQQASVNWRVEGNWTYIQNDVITIVFPADGKKPMFLWWYTKDPENINVVKYKGLIEYVTFDQPYFVWRHQAEQHVIRERLQLRFIGQRMLQAMTLEKLRLMAEENLYALHAPYLPFSACKWELSVPVNVSRGDVKYLSFNFTLVDVPGYRPHLQFAENNVIIRCRFYYTPATENVEGKYSYTVEAGELKMDLVIKHWEWNIDKLTPLLEELKEQDVDVPATKTGLALWVNLASINMTKLDTAAGDAVAEEDLSITEGASTARNMYVEGENVSLVQNRAGIEDEQPLQNRIRERYRFRFEKGNATLAGFFKFVPQALVRNATTNEVLDVVDVAASYVSGGAHMRVFLGYPYFGNNTLEHDPSLGLEVLSVLVEPLLVVGLLVAVAVVASLVIVVRWRRRIVNVVGVH